jgi:hypothetical protein
MRTDISQHVADPDIFQKQSGLLKGIAVVLRNNIVQGEKVAESAEDGVVYRMFSSLRISCYL